MGIALGSLALLFVMVLDFILYRKKTANRRTNLATTPEEEPYVKQKAELEAEDRVFEAPALSLPLLRFWFQGGRCSVKTISSSGRDNGTMRCRFRTKSLRCPQWR